MVKKLKTEQKLLIIVLTAFICGIIAGALHMAFSAENTELYSYLNNFLNSISNTTDKFAIFKRSLSDNLKLLLIITLCGFFKFGFAGSFFCCSAKGFAIGFTTSAFLRYYGIRGLLIPLSSLLSTIIFLPIFIIFCAYSSYFSLKCKKTEKKFTAFFLIFSLICFSIFCVTSFSDAYLTTTFMKILSPYLGEI